MKILILGAGGTGGYFGGRLFESGADVSFLVRAPRAELLRKHGLVIHSPKGDAKLTPPILTQEEIKAPFDLILLSCKAYDLDSAISTIRPAVGPKTLILPILNGMKHLDTLDAAFGKEKVLAGFAQIAVTLGANGEINHLNTMETLGFGVREASQKESALRFAEILKKVPIDGRLSEQPILEMWEKWVFLTTLASMTCLMRGSVGDILKAKPGESLLLEMYDELGAISKAAGYPTRPEVKAAQHKILTDKASTLTASMFRDLKQGARIEADAIVGDFLLRGEAAKLPVNLLKTAFTHLSVYEAQRTKS